MATVWVLVGFAGGVLVGWGLCLAQLEYERRKQEREKSAKKRQKLYERQITELEL